MTFNPYAPLRFNRDRNDPNGEWIPAIIEPRRIDAREEPAGFTGHIIPIGSRDPVGLADPIDNPAWRRQSPRVGFGDGELHWHFYAWEIDPEFFNKTFAYYQKKCGDIRSNVAWLHPTVVREMLMRLEINGFSRNEPMEKPNSTQQAWLQSPARPWKVA
jgi:hypothetical protein